MGIRFLCPNGHKLNVKSFLAGKRGICPQCDAKFLVPETSGGQAEAIVETVEQEALSSDSGSGDASHRGSTVPPLPPAMPTEAGSAPAEVWYVRTATGDQFGPANTATMRGWIEEGRVPVESWVWRTGWPEWKTGGQAITFLNGPPVQTMPQPAAPIADTPMPELPVDATTAPLPESSLPESTSTTIQHRTSRRSRQERARKLTLFLGGLVLLLLVVLVAVLINNN